MPTNTPTWAELQHQQRLHALSGELIYLKSFKISATELLAEIGPNKLLQRQLDNAPRKRLRLLTTMGKELGLLTGEDD